MQGALSEQRTLLERRRGQRKYLDILSPTIQGLGSYRPSTATGLESKLRTLGLRQKIGWIGASGGDSGKKPGYDGHGLGLLRTRELVLSAEKTDSSNSKKNGLQSLREGGRMMFKTPVVESEETPKLYSSKLMQTSSSLGNKVSRKNRKDEVILRVRDEINKKYDTIMHQVRDLKAMVGQLTHYQQFGKRVNLGGHNNQQEESTLPLQDDTPTDKDFSITDESMKRPMITIFPDRSSRGQISVRHKGQEIKQVKSPSNSSTTPIQEIKFDTLSPRELLALRSRIDKTINQKRENSHTPPKDIGSKLKTSKTSHNILNSAQPGTHMPTRTEAMPKRTATLITQNVPSNNSNSRQQLIDKKHISNIIKNSSNPHIPLDKKIDVARFSMYRKKMHEELISPKAETTNQGRASSKETFQVHSKAESSSNIGLDNFVNDSFNNPMRAIQAPVQQNVLFGTLRQLAMKSSASFQAASKTPNKVNFEQKEVQTNVKDQLNGEKIFLKNKYQPPIIASSANDVGGVKIKDNNPRGSHTIGSMPVAEEEGNRAPREYSPRAQPQTVLKASIWDKKPPLPVQHTKPTPQSTSIVDKKPDESRAETSNNEDIFVLTKEDACNDDALQTYADSDTSLLEIKEGLEKYTLRPPNLPILK